MFDEEAGVFDDDEASNARFFGGGRVRDALLEPEDLGVDRDGRIGDGRNAFGAAEDVDDVDGLGDVFEAGVGFLAQDFGFVGVDGDDFVTGGLQVGGDFVGRTARVGGESDDSDGFGGAEDLGDGVGGRSGVVRKVKEHRVVRCVRAFGVTAEG